MVTGVPLTVCAPGVSLGLCCSTGKGRGKKILLPFQLAVLIGISITYTVVAGQSLHAFAGGVTPEGNRTLGVWAYIIMFGGLQLLLSMVSGSAELSWGGLGWAWLQLVFGWVL